MPFVTTLYEPRGVTAVSKHADVGADDTRDYVRSLLYPGPTDRVENEHRDEYRRVVSAMTNIGTSFGRGGVHTVMPDGSKLSVESATYATLADAVGIDINEMVGSTFAACLRILRTFNDQHKELRP